tara:strand:+ start:135770 stop:136180 length:411 start_codon:yes stop_codon:yes gene_type:complete
MSPHLLLKKPKRSVEDNMVPMINIVFLLLIFFMIAGQIQSRGNSQLKLPVSTLGIKAEPGELQLELDQSSQLTLNGQVLSLEELDRRLGGPGASDDRVSLRADKSLTAAELDAVLQIFRQQGMASVTLISTELGES